MNKVTFPLIIAPIYRRRIVFDFTTRQGTQLFRAKSDSPRRRALSFHSPGGVNQWISKDLSCDALNHNMSRLKTGIMPYNKQIGRIVFPSAATNLTLKKVKGQGHDMVPIERACHKDHASLISMLYL